EPRSKVPLEIQLERVVSSVIGGVFERLHVAQIRGLLLPRVGVARDDSHQGAQNACQRCNAVDAAGCCGIAVYRSMQAPATHQPLRQWVGRYATHRGGSRVLDTKATQPAIAIIVLAEMLPHQETAKVLGRRERQSCSRRPKPTPVNTRFVQYIGLKPRALQS